MEPTRKTVPTIFLSYSWHNLTTADIIDRDFSNIGITFLRDQRDAIYRSSLTEFMQRVGKSDFVVMLISDEFLKSEYCMYEMTELLNTHEFEKRILPVALDNASAAFNPKTRTIYYDYWKQELATAEKQLHDYLNTDYMLQKKKMETICLQLDDFFSKLTDLRILPFEALRQQHYKPLLETIGFDKELLMDELIAINLISDPEEQEIALDNFLEKHPGNEHALFIKAVLATKMKQYKKAKSLYQKVIAVNPETPAVYNNLALLYHHFLQEEEGQQRIETARHLYEKEIAQQPWYDAAHYNLAVLLEKKVGDREAAKKEYLRAIEINPRYVKAHYNLANLLALPPFSDYDGAKSHYERAVKSDPLHAGAHNNLALILKNHFKQYEEARMHFEKAVAINPDLAVAHYQLAELLLFNRLQTTAAKEHYLQATQLDSALISKELDVLFEIKRS